MTNTNQTADHYVNARIEAIKALRKIQKTVDPASGMSLCVRRGVLHDGEDEPEDRRPWVRMELCDHMEAILELAIDAQLSSLKQWTLNAGRDSIRLAQAERAGLDFLEKEAKQ